jgi:hypothetical protein
MISQVNKFFISGLVVILLIIATFNYVMNPFRVYNAPDITHINKEKVTFHNYLHLGKAHALYHADFDNLILGTSRAGVGLNPEHEGWEGLTYNLGIPGGTMLEVLRYFEHYHQYRPVKKVVLALDFSSFNIYKKAKPSFSESRLRKSPVFGKLNTRLHDLVPTLLSASAFNQSLYILRRNLITTSESITRFMKNGQAEWTYHFQEIRDNGGNRVLMQDVENNYKNNIWLPEPEKKFDFQNMNKSESTLNYYKQILDIAYRDGIEVEIIVSPFHASLLEALDEVGLWSIFENWKKSLVEINEYLSRKYKVPAFSVWDYSGYNSINTEAVPPLNDTENLMMWFWDGTHFRPELGEIILDQLLDYKSDERTIPEDFGTIINSQNIDHVQSDMRFSQIQYRKRIKSSYDEVRYDSSN